MAYECVTHICSAICSCLLGFNFRQEQGPTSLQIHTSSVTTNTELILPLPLPSSSSLSTPSSSSSSSSSPSGKLTYDVFLSFRGIDTRKKFTDHLYTALIQKGIHTFRDDEELKSGESIGPNILKAIEESRYVIVILSQGYTDSAWCLDELAKVVECMKTKRQIVLPVFYDVHPFEVRRQKGDSFEKAFEKHQKRNPDKLQRWKDALFEVSNLSGWHLQNRYEAKIIQEIVEFVFTELNKIISTSEGLVGMDSHLEKMLPYLDIQCPDVRIIGICGMGGSGKSTIAQVVFNRLKAQFECASFLQNVREEMERQGVIHLQKQLLSDLLTCNVKVHNTEMGKNIMRQRLNDKRVLLILDDVDDAEQLEVLCDRGWYGPGSRIIITSRNVHLLTAVEGDKVYNVNPLTESEALQLFSMKAFKKDQQVGDEFLKLSEEFVKYTNGLPLAIKVLGSSVKDRSVDLWLSALDRLKKSPERKYINLLKVSFDGLEPREKRIFLDIACFLKGESIASVRRILQGSDAICPDIDLQVLQDKSLVTLFGKRLWMHDLIQELGWEIVRQEFPEEPEKRSRLWFADEILDVLDENTATCAIQSILLIGPTKDNGVHSINGTFSNMKRLRLLKISNVKFSGNIKYLSKKLQFLYWAECPLHSFPIDFQPDYLVELYMPSSCIKQLWRGQRGWSMLRLIDLSGSQYLMSTPDFTDVSGLETLVLQECTCLVEIHPSLGFLKKLCHLDMRNCESLESIPPFVSLESLEYLDLSFCSRLKRFPEVKGNMKWLLELHLEGAGIEELPPSIEFLTGLITVNLKDCKNLLRLPNTIGCLSSFKSLYLTGCSKLDEIAGNLYGMKYLEKLFIAGTYVRKLSFVVGMKNLRYLSCRGCKHLDSESFQGLASSSLIELDLSDCELMDGAILDDLSNLISLSLLNLSGNCFVRLPESIRHLSKLSTLDLSNCRQLQFLPKELPSSLKTMLAHDCTSLSDYPNQIKVLSTFAVINSLNSSAPGVSERVIQENEGNTGTEQVHDFPATTLAGLREFDSSRKNITSVLPTDDIPEWFGDISTKNPISIPLPQNLINDTKWKGFAVCAIFSVKGHTAFSLVEPDPERFTHLYQVTLETDLISLDPVALRRVQGPGGPHPSLRSCSHFLVIFYMPYNWQFQPRGLSESTVMRAKFETTNPSMVVQRCAIRLVYEKDDGWHSSIILEFDSIVCLNNVNDTADSEMELDWLSESVKWEEFIPPREEEHKRVLIKNLESVLPRYIEALNQCFATFNFNISRSPLWFSSPISFGARPNVQGSINMPHKSKWMGVAVCASLVEEVGQTIMEGETYKVFVRLTSRDNSGCITCMYSRLLEHVRPLSEEHHQLLVFYIPRAQISEALLTQTKVDLNMSIGSLHVKFYRFGLRFVYLEDIQGFADTIIRCMQMEDSLEFHNKWVVEKWMQVIRFGGGCLKRITERDSRTPWEKYMELRARKYRNWDWNDPRPFHCYTTGAEIFKSKWFMPFINQGNSAEIQLPANLFDDDNWLGFAACSQLSNNQRRNINVGGVAPDIDHFTLGCCMKSDVAWHNLFGSTMYANFTVVGPCKCDVTMFFYIPRNGRVRQWRQCKSAGVTMWLSSKSGFAVHNCALRLLFKEDVEDLVQALTLAELSRTPASIC